MDTPVTPPNTDLSSQVIPLELIRIASPCRAEWDKMTGDDKVRFCSSCAKNVYNFSTMTRAEAERLMQEKEGNVCIRLHRRADGTVITSDCAVGLSAVKRSGRGLKAVFAMIVAALSSVLGLGTVRAVTVTAGAPSVPAKGDAPFLMGEPIVPTPRRAAKVQGKPVKIPSKQKKSYGNRAPRKPSHHIRPSGLRPGSGS